MQECVLSTDATNALAQEHQANINHVAYEIPTIIHSLWTTLEKNMFLKKYLVVKG